MSKQGDEIVSRRKILTGGGLLAGSAAFVAGTGLAGTAKAQGGTYTEADARQEVEYLRRWYGGSDRSARFIEFRGSNLPLTKAERSTGESLRPTRSFRSMAPRTSIPLWIQLRTSGPIS